MADMKKVATRDSYGNALAALGAEHENLVVWMPTWQALPRPAFSRRLSPTASSTAVSLRPT